MMSWPTNFIITIITTKIFDDPLAFLSDQHCTTEEGERVVENVGCYICNNKFFQKDIIELLSCCLYFRQPVEFFNPIYIYIYMVNKA